MNQQTRGQKIALAVALGVLAVLGVGIVFVHTQPKSERMMQQGENMMLQSEILQEKANRMKDEAAQNLSEAGIMMEEAQSISEKESMSEIESMSGTESVTETESSTVENLEILTYKGELLAGSLEASPFLVFDEMDYLKAREAGKNIVLFFYASWCPLCKQEIANAVVPAFNELTRNDVVGFRVNYNDLSTNSAERDLAREFQIGYQHTKVLLDTTGTQVREKTQETWSREKYLSEIVTYFGEQTINSLLM